MNKFLDLAGLTRFKELLLSKIDASLSLKADKSSLSLVSTSGSYDDLLKKPKVNGSELKPGDNDLKKIYGDDNRGVATAPSDYQRGGGMLAHAGMRNGVTLGIPSVRSLGAVLEVSSWRDNSGGPVHELGFFNGSIFLRTNADSDTWDAWKKLSIIPTGGTSAQFVKADGSLDSSTYLTAADVSGKAEKTYVDSQLSTKADKTAIPTVPTVVSAFKNDAGYLTQHQSLAAYATTASVNSALALKADKSSLSAVATSGSYNDLKDKPTALTYDDFYPVGSVYLTKDSAFNPAVKFGGTWKNESGGFDTVIVWTRTA